MCNELNPIGIGTYKLDLDNKIKTLEGLLHSYYSSQNFISTSLMYDNGLVVDFLANFFNKIDREKIFVMSHLESYILKKEDIEKQVDEYLKRMKLEYIDSVQVHTGYVTKIPLLDTYGEINKLVEKGKVKYLSVSNVNLDQLKELTKNFKIFSFEGVYNLECKTYENMGLIDYCKQNGIKFISYQALRRNKIAEKNYPFLLEMANKYNKTQNQILLNWLIKEKGLKTLIKTTNIERIDENLNALNFKLDKEDVTVLNEFQNEKFNSIEIDWENKGGITIDKLASQNF